MKIKKLTAFVIFCIAMIILYVITAIVVQVVKGYALDTALTVGMFGFFGTELAASCVLKVFRIRKEE